MEEFERKLEAMLADVGGFRRCYLKLVRMAKRLKQAALTVRPGNRRLAEMEATDFVNDGCIRLIEEGPGDLTPYYALRNFVRNSIRTKAKSPYGDREIPIGGDSEEWAEYWENTYEPTEEHPDQFAERQEAVSHAMTVLFRLRGALEGDADALEILAARELGFGKRSEIINETNLDGPAYDRALKRIQRKAIQIPKEMKNE